MGNWITPIKNNKELIELAFKQIEEETKFHIIDKEYNDDEYTEEKDKNTICEFHIKEIPGFRFAFWNTRRSEKQEEWFEENRVKWLNGLDVSFITELIFFTQYERDLDKFKPSRSGFVTGIYRTEYISEPDSKEEKVEPFVMYDVIDILKYMKKHKIRSVEYSGCQSRFIWDDDRPYIKIFFQYIHDWLYHWRYQLKDWLKVKKAIRVSKKYMKKLSQFNYIIEDRGDICYPRIEVLVRRKDKVNLLQYEKDWNIIDEFDSKYSNILNINWLQYEINDKTTEDIIKKDKDCRDTFFWHCNIWINKTNNNEWEENQKVVAYSVEQVEDLNEILNRKKKEI